MWNKEKGRFDFCILEGTKPDPRDLFVFFFVHVGLAIANFSSERTRYRGVEGFIERGNSFLRGGAGDKPHPGRGGAMIFAILD